MAKIKPIQLKDFKGGLNLNEETTIEDNELSLATNVFYDDDKKLTSRRGIKNFGDQIPDSVVVINSCDAATNFAASDDAANIAGGTAIRGSASVEFDITVAGSGNDYATVTNASLGTVDASAANGFLGFWIFVPTGFNTNLTDVKVRLGSDSSNYHEWTLSALTENSNQFIQLAFSSATDTGSPDDSSVDYFRLQITYSAAYLDQANILIDDINTYSAAYSKGTHSLMFWETSTGVRRLNAACGTSLFEWDETSENWFMIKNGLTDGERFSHFVYNDVLYLSNGSDNYMDYNGTVVTERTGANTRKGRYMALANDVGYIAGVDGARSILNYSASAPTNMQTFANTLDIEADNGQVITGLSNLGAIVLVFKEKSIYDVNIATPSRTQLDYSGGATSHRSVSKVENDVYFLSDNGVFSLFQREGTTGSLRANPISEDLQPLIDVLKTTNIAAAVYWPKTNQYYLSVDSSGSGTNNDLLVYNVRVRGWTRYTNVNANDFTVYIDSSGDEHLLFADVFSGRVKELETGFSDNDVDIAVGLATKSYDFEVPSLTKEFREFDIIGFISDGGEITASIEVDGQEVKSKTIQGSNFTGGSETITLGTSPLGVYPLTGEAVADDAIVLNLFKVRINVYITGIRVKLKLTSVKKNTAWVLSQAQIVPDPQPLDIFANSQII